MNRTNDSNKPMQNTGQTDIQIDRQTHNLDWTTLGDIDNISINYLPKEDEEKYAKMTLLSQGCSLFSKKMKNNLKNKSVIF